MSSDHHRRVWKGFTIALIAAPLIAAAAVDDPAAPGVKSRADGTAEGAPKAHPQGKAKAAFARAAARRLAAGGTGAMMPDLRALAGAARKERLAAPAVTSEAFLAKVGRPERTVTPPTLTSAELDELIGRTLADAKVAPARLADDATFLRRVSIDLTGVPPTPKVLGAFVRDSDPKKRAKMIDSLLKSEAYGRNWARYWRDTITYHATTTQPRFTNSIEFVDWMGDALVENRPWDEIVRDILTATGDTGENGATMMVMAHSDQKFQPVEMAGEVSRIFMGVQIACAQCHDHPTDSWKREQFHEFAAFFNGVAPRRQGKQPAIEVTVVDRPGRSRYTMPDLEDPQKQIPVAPKFFLTSSETTLPPNATTAQLRALMASYVTGQDNPWFARAYVNRIWYALLGESFYEAVDDLGPEREAHASEIIDTLASAWAKGGYDVRWLFETIMNTRAYQRQTRSTQSAPGRTPFASNCPSRLRADQILDTLAQVLGVRFEPPARPAPAMESAEKEKTAVQVLMERRRRNGPRAQFNALFGFDPSLANEDVLDTIPQALFLMNAPQVQRAIEARRGTMLARILANNADNRAALDALYVQVLSRRPTGDELKTCSAHLERAGNRTEAFEDILWALLNSTEFVSRR